MFNYLLNELEVNVNDRARNQSVAEYFFNVKTIINAIANLENQTQPYRNLKYFKQTIKFENYIGLEYMNYEVLVKDPSHPMIKEDKIVKITEDTIKDPLFKAMLVVLMNIKLPSNTSVPDRIDPYDNRHVKGNMWYKLLSYIIQDGTLEQEVVDWIMIFALIGDNKRRWDSEEKTSYEIEYNGQSMRYRDLINEPFNDVQQYRSIAEGILENSKLNGVYMNRRFSCDGLDLYLSDLRYEYKKVPEFISFLEFYHESKYYNEYIEAIYINCPIFNAFKSRNLMRGVFGSRYRRSTDCASMKAVITDANNIHSLLANTANENHHYKEILKKIDEKFVDEFINIVNGDFNELFSTSTMGALRRSVYEQRLNDSEVEGFKFMSEIADRFTNRKFAKSISKYYTDKIL